MTFNLAVNGIVTGFYPGEITRGGWLNYDLLEARNRRIGANPRQIVIEPLHDVAQHEVILRGIAPCIPSLRETGGALFELESIAGPGGLIVHRVDNVGPATLGQRPQKVAVTHVARGQSIPTTGHILDHGIQDGQAIRGLDEPASTAPIDAVISALEAAGAVLEERRDSARQRQAVIAANAELQERELIKLAALAAALAAALRLRGVKDPAAILTAEAGIAVFKVAFERWINETNYRYLSRIVRESLDELRAVTAAR